MAGQKIRMKVRQEDVFDAEAVLRGEGQVAVHVALGVDDRGDSGGFVANQIGGVGQAIQVELLQDH
jgi:hypothetical protein